MRKVVWPAVLVALLVSGQAGAAADTVPIQFSSGDRRVILIELFTSEGCNSCPPADRWFSRLETHPNLWKSFTPVAFHVDYWDYIGWQDRFARAEYSDRQRRYAAEGGSRFVYTPGVFRNGQDWPGWRTAARISRSSPRVGDLALRVKGHNIDARFEPTAFYDSDLTLHVVVLGMNLETRVGAGENSGRTLSHDFVTLGMKSVRLEKTGASFRANTLLPATSIQPRHRALAAWVSAKGEQAPIQSVGGFLPAADTATLQQ